MVIVAGKERLTRRGAERRRMELRVTQPFLRERIERGHVDAPAEGARRAEAYIIEQNHDYVGRTFGRPEQLDGRKLRIASVQRNLARIFVLRVWYRQLSTIDLLCGRGNDLRGDPHAQCGSKNQK